MVPARLGSMRRNSPDFPDATCPTSGEEPHDRRSLSVAPCILCLAMLTLHPAHDAAGATLTEAGWIDLFDPTEEERSRVEEALGLRVPTKAEISEIETTSRLRSDGEALYMSAPLISVAENG